MRRNTPDSDCCPRRSFLREHHRSILVCTGRLPYKTATRWYYVSLYFFQGRRDCRSLRFTLPSLRAFIVHWRIWDFARRALRPENDRLELELSEPDGFSSGSIGGFNAHAASILTAVYLANGQDLHMKNSESLHIGEGQ